MSVEGDLENQEQIRKFKEEGGGALPLFETHEQLAHHLINMPDSKLNRMRDFGCGKPHWSPLYSEPAYKFESRAIEGDKISMAMTVPLPGEVRYELSPPSRGKSGASSSPAVPSLPVAGGGTSARSGPTPRDSARLGLTSARADPDPLKNTVYVPPASAQASARRRQAADDEEAARIEELLKVKQEEINTLKEQLAKTKRK